LFLKNCTHGVPMIPAASAISGSSSISISTKCTLWSYSSITCHGKFWKKIKTLLLCNLRLTIPSNKEVKVVSLSYYVMHNITINVFSYISIEIHVNTFTTVHVLNFKSWSWRMHREDDYSLEWSLTATIYPQHQTELTGELKDSRVLAKTLSDVVVLIHLGCMKSKKCFWFCKSRGYWKQNTWVGTEVWIWFT